MTKPMIRIHNIETDEIIDREMTDAEYTKYQIEQDENAKIGDEQVKQNAQAVADKAALLAKLGISADEAKLLLS